MKTFQFLLIVVMGSSLLGSSLYFQQKAERSYFKQPFEAASIQSIIPRFVYFEDTIPNDTIYICFSRNEFPFAYYREVFTPVCYDSLCLPVWLNIYWSPGGEYLGYRILDDGIFTKHEHSPFLDEDYLKLQVILNDPQSILMNYRINELVSDSQSQTDSVDGWSGATILDIKNEVVQGAVYTTYTLWHTVYGSSIDTVRRLSADFLSASFLEYLINSPYIQDVYYAMDNMKRYNLDINESILLKLKELINSDDIGLVENSIDILVSSEISDSIRQEILVGAFNESAYSIKLRILRILGNSSVLLPGTITTLCNHLSAQNGVVVRKILILFENRDNVDLSNKITITELFEHENRFIAKMAYDYITQLETLEDALISRIQEYEAKFVTAD